MAALALVVPPEVAGTSVLSYVSHHVGAYVERGVSVGAVVLSSTQARILFDMAYYAHADNTLPPTLLGMQLIIREARHGVA